jgi:hypothetical protein
MSKEREPASGAPEGARRATGGAPEERRDGGLVADILQLSSPGTWDAPKPIHKRCTLSGAVT